MADEIRPALTPEEWANTKPIVLAIGKEPELMVLSEWAHKAAALCLAHKPFGFTWEDVDAIRVTADALEHDGLGVALAVPALRSIADRIAAILPPRKP